MMNTHVPSEYDGMMIPCGLSIVPDDFEKARIERDASVVRLEARVAVLELRCTQLEEERGR